MIFSEKEIQEIINGRFSLYFAEATLRQKCDDPIVYHGPGKLFYTDEGKLSIELFCLNQNEKESSENRDRKLDQISNYKPGQLIPREHYFDLDATDISGQQWHAENIWFPRIACSGSMGEIIVFEIQEYILYQKNRQTEKEPNLIFYVNGKFNLPWNKYQQKENSCSLNICELEFENFSFYAENFDDNFMIVKLSSYEPEKLTKNHKELSRLFLEALRIATGRFIQPVLCIENFDQKQTVRIQSRKKTIETKSIKLPLYHTHPDSRSFSEFIKCYLAYQEEPLSMLYRYWFKILDVQENHFENLALVLTTSIEGILREYFNESGLPEQDFVEKSDKTKNIISDAQNIPEEIKGRIKSSLGQIKTFSASNALRKLQEINVISQDMRTSWGNLRNKVAHGNSLELESNDNDLTVAQNLDCLTIFYILLLKTIKYNGKFINYSKENWPEEFL